MAEFHIWVAQSDPAPSGFVIPEVRVTTEPIVAELFTEAVQAHIDSLPEGQQGLWEQGVDGAWTLRGCRVNPESEALTLFEDGLSGEIVEEAEFVDTGLPAYELWISSSAVPEETTEPVVMLTAEPIAAESFDAAVKIYKDHLCDPATAANVELTGSGAWLLNGEEISDVAG